MEEDGEEIAIGRRTVAPTASVRMTTAGFLSDSTENDSRGGRLVKAVLGALVVCLVATACEAGVTEPDASGGADIWVKWDRQSDPAVDRYIVYVGKDLDDPDAVVTVDAPTDSVTIQVVENGQYFVAVRAVNVRGVEGPLSDRASVSVP